MSLKKTIRIATQISKEIDRANKRAIREREKRERALAREKKREAAELERVRKQLERENIKRKKEELKAALENEQMIFEERVKTRKLLRLELINKVTK